MAEKGFKIKSAEQVFLTSMQKEKEQEELKGMEIPAGYQLTRTPKSARINLLIRPDIKEAIHRLAKIEGTSANNLINDILEKYAKERGEL